MIETGAWHIMLATKIININKKYTQRRSQCRRHRICRYSTLLVKSVWCSRSRADAVQVIAVQLCQPSGSSRSSQSSRRCSRSSWKCSRSSRRCNLSSRSKQSRWCTPQKLDRSSTPPVHSLREECSFGGLLFRVACAHRKPERGQQKVAQQWKMFRVIYHRRQENRLLFYRH
jgi:hypothetical protein